MLKEDRLFAVSALDGSMRAQTADGHGLWLGDTRFLSEYHVLVAGEEPQLRSLQAEGGIVDFKLNAGRLRVHRERYIDHGLHDRITFSNTGSEHFSAHLELRFDNDFAGMLVVRGIIPVPPRPAAYRRKSRPAPSQKAWELKALVLIVPVSFELRGKSALASR